MSRPTKYDPAFDKQAEKFCKLGATEAEIADFFDVDPATIHRWKKEYSSFCNSIKKGKMLADANVADRLYQRAMGYSHKAVKILSVPMGNGGGSQVEQVPYVEHYPPDTAAAIFWLKNRRSDKWRDKTQVALTDMSDDELIKRACELAARGGATGPSATTGSDPAPDAPEDVA